MTEGSIMSKCNKEEAIDRVLVSGDNLFLLKIIKTQLIQINIFFNLLGKIETLPKSPCL